eukprot:364694-Chlamydomonas_euryale.AAC.3
MHVRPDGHTLRSWPRKRTNGGKDLPQLPPSREDNRLTAAHMRTSRARSCQLRSTTNLNVTGNRQLRSRPFERAKRARWGHVHRRNRD